MKRALLFLSFVCIALGSCKKDKQILVEDNTAPPDGTIPNVVKENYVNKSYISILGRKPVASELSAGEAILNKNNLSVPNRIEMLDGIIAKPGYNQRLYDISLVNLLNNLDTSQITQYIALFGMLLTDTSYMSQWAQIQAEKTKLELLKSAPADLQSGAITIIGLHKRCANNFFYDQINMGTENFVVSMFQNFFFRYPSDEELKQGKQMVDGFAGVLFFQTGHSKDDFINILLGSDNYYEGQVRDLYLRYLFREPSSVESSTETKNYKTSGNYKTLQKDILSLNEYVGL